jgi:inhibitor of cysteine peptidase
VVSRAGLTLTVDSDGDVHDVGGGQEVHVVLPEIPTSGFRWSLSVDGPVEVVDDSYEAEGSGVGGGGSRRFVVRTRDGGRAELRAVLRQQWNPSEPAERWAASLDVAS